MPEGERRRQPLDMIRAYPTAHVKDLPDRGAESVVDETVVDVVLDLCESQDGRIMIRERKDPLHDLPQRRI